MQLEMRRRWPASLTMIGSAIILSIFSFSPALAGTIERHCVKMGSAYGAAAFACTLQFRGEIVQGDAALVEAAIRSSPSHVEVASFDSPGGSPFEALKISDILNANFVAFATGSCRPTIGCDVGSPGKLCASACTLIYLAANERFGTEVYVHRPTFPAEMFAGLSGPEAQVAYETTVDRLTDALRAHHVPEEQIQLMMSIPSGSLSKMPLNYPSESPWMDEWLTAKCGQTYSADGVSAKDLICKTDAILAEQRRVQGKN